MSRPNIVSKLIARVRGLSEADWAGMPGARIRQTFKAVSDFAKRHGVSAAVEDGVQLGRNKITGLANKEFADSLKAFSEAELKNIEAETLRRSLHSRVRKEEADARMAEIQVVNAELDLRKKLKDMNVALSEDDAGNLTVIPARLNLTKAVPRSDGSTGNEKDS